MDVETDQGKVNKLPFMTRKKENKITQESSDTVRDGLRVLP